MDSFPSPALRPVPWVVFDGDCAFCTSSATWVAERLHRPGRPAARLVPWQFTDLQTLGTTSERAQRELLWVTADGVIEGGAQAFAAWLCYAGRPYAALGTVMRWPAVSGLAGAVYRLVARNRQRMPGGTPACALPPAAVPDPSKPRR